MRSTVTKQPSSGGKEKRKIRKWVLSEPDRTDVRMTAVHNLMIAFVVILAVWNGVLAFYWMNPDLPVRIQFLPKYPDAAPLFGVLTLVAALVMGLAAYGLGMMKEKSFSLAVYSVLAAAFVRYALYLPVWALEGIKGSCLAVFLVDAVSSVGAIGLFLYYRNKQDHFNVKWSKDAVHHLVIVGMFLLLGWCAYCGIWWMGTQEVVFSAVWSIGYPQNLPCLPQGGWPFGLLSAIMVVYCIAGINGLIRRSKNAEIMAVLAFPLMAELQLGAYCYETIQSNVIGATPVQYRETGFLLLTACFVLLGFVLLKYYKSRTDEFCNSW